MWSFNPLGISPFNLLGKLASIPMHRYQNVRQHDLSLLFFPFLPRNSTKSSTVVGVSPPIFPIVSCCGIGESPSFILNANCSSLLTSGRASSPSRKVATSERRSSREQQRLYCFWLLTDLRMSVYWSGSISLIQMEDYYYTYQQGPSNYLQPQDDRHQFEEPVDGESGPGPLCICILLWDGYLIQNNQQNQEYRFDMSVSSMSGSLDRSALLKGSITQRLNDRHSTIEVLLKGIKQKYSGHHPQVSSTTDYLAQVLPQIQKNSKLKILEKLEKLESIVEALKSVESANVIDKLNQLKSQCIRAISPVSQPIEQNPAEQSSCNIGASRKDDALSISINGRNKVQLTSVVDYGEENVHPNRRVQQNQYASQHDKRTSLLGTLLGGMGDEKPMVSSKYMEGIVGVLGVDTRSKKERMRRKKALEMGTDEVVVTKQRKSRYLDAIELNQAVAQAVSSRNLLGVGADMNMSRKQQPSIQLIDSGMNGNSRSRRSFRYGNGDDSSDYHNIHDTHETNHITINQYTNPSQQVNQQSRHYTTDQRTTNQYNNSHQQEDQAANKALLLLSKKFQHSMNNIARKSRANIEGEMMGNDNSAGKKKSKNSMNKINQDEGSEIDFDYSSDDSEGKKATASQKPPAKTKEVQMYSFRENDQRRPGDNDKRRSGNNRNDDSCSDHDSLTLHSHQASRTDISVPRNPELFKYTFPSSTKNKSSYSNLIKKSLKSTVKQAKKKRTQKQWSSADGEPHPNYNITISQSNIQEMLDRIKQRIMVSCVVIDSVSFECQNDQMNQKQIDSRFNKESNQIRVLAKQITEPREWKSPGKNIVKLHEQGKKMEREYESEIWRSIQNLRKGATC